MQLLTLFLLIAAALFPNSVSASSQIHPKYDPFLQTWDKFDQFSLNPTTQSINISDFPKVNGLIKVEKDKKVPKVLSTHFESYEKSFDLIRVWISPINRNKDRFYLKIPNSDDLIAILCDENDHLPICVFSKWQIDGSKFKNKGFLNQSIVPYGYYSRPWIEHVLEYKPYGYWLIGRSKGADGGEISSSIWIGFMYYDSKFEILHHTVSDWGDNELPPPYSYDEKKLILTVDKKKLIVQIKEKAKTIKVMRLTPKSKKRTGRWKTIAKETINLKELVKAYK